MPISWPSGRGSIHENSVVESIISSERTKQRRGYWTFSMIIHNKLRNLMNKIQQVILYIYKYKKASVNGSEYYKVPVFYID